LELGLFAVRGATALQWKGSNGKMRGTREGFEKKKKELSKLAKIPVSTAGTTLTSTKVVGKRRLKRETEKGLTKKSRGP